MAQGAAARWATYDSQKGLLVLDHAVELTTQRAMRRFRFHAQHAEFERESQVCLLHTATANYRAAKPKPATRKSLPAGWIGGAAGCDERLQHGHGDGGPRERGPPVTWTLTSTTSRATATWRAGWRWTRRASLAAARQMQGTAPRGAGIQRAGQAAPRASGAGRGNGQPGVDVSGRVSWRAKRSG